MATVVNPVYEEWFAEHERNLRTDAVHSNRGLGKLLEAAGLKGHIQWRDFDNLEARTKGHRVFEIIKGLREYHAKLVQRDAPGNVLTYPSGTPAPIGEMVSGQDMTLPIDIPVNKKKRNYKKKMLALEIAIQQTYYTYLESLDEDEDEDLIGPYLKENGFKLPFADSDDE